MLGGTILSSLLALEKEYPCNEEQRLERLNCYWPTCETARDGDMHQGPQRGMPLLPVERGSRWAHRWEGNLPPCCVELVSWLQKKLVPKVTAQVVVWVLRHTSS